MSDYIYFIYAGLGSAAVSAIFYTVYRNREGAIRSLQVRIFSISSLGFVFENYASMVFDQLFKA